jgi:hypothetical protein
MDIKFTGNFKDLKGMGFKFHKLFANNYKVYEKDKIWIWVARGGYVEVADFYELSGYIVDAIWNDTFPVYEKNVDYGEKLSWLNRKKGDKKPCQINRKTGEIVERREFTKKYCDENGEYDYDLWRELSIYKETFESIKELKDIMEIVK